MEFKRRYHANILKPLDYALSEGYIIANPAKRVALPKLEKYVASFYNQDELNRPFKAEKGTRMETITLLTAYYGLRRSEVLGLKWQSIDFAGNCITIENKVIHAKDGGKVVVKSKPNLKNTSSRRSLPLTCAKSCPRILLSMLLCAPLFRFVDYNSASCENFWNILVNQAHGSGIKIHPLNQTTGVLCADQPWKPDGYKLFLEFMRKRI